jgi:hypothetical protein
MNFERRKLDGNPIIEELSQLNCELHYSTSPSDYTRKILYEYAHIPRLLFLSQCNFKSLERNI